MRGGGEEERTGIEGTQSRDVGRELGLARIRLAVPIAISTELVCNEAGQDEGRCEEWIRINISNWIRIGQH